MPPQREIEGWLDIEGIKHIFSHTSASVATILLSGVGALVIHWTMPTGQLQSFLERVDGVEVAGVSVFLTLDIWHFFAKRSFSKLIPQKEDSSRVPDE
jgi:hypothetical protein